MTIENNRSIKTVWAQVRYEEVFMLYVTSYKISYTVIIYPVLKKVNFGHSIFGTHWICTFETDFILGQSYFVFKFFIAQMKTPRILNLLPLIFFIQSALTTSYLLPWTVKVGFWKIDIEMMKYRIFRFVRLFWYYVRKFGVRIWDN